MMSTSVFIDVFFDVLALIQQEYALSLTFYRDFTSNYWYSSRMTQIDSIPVFQLFGETSAFPDVLHWERIRDRASEHGWNISPHRHSQMSQLFLIETGEADAQIDGQSVTVSQNSYLYIPSQVVHAFAFTQDTEGSVLSFPLDVVNSIGPISQDALQGLGQVVKGATPEDLTSLLRLFSQRYADTGIYRSQCIVGLAHTILAIIAEAANETNATSNSTQSIRIQQLNTLITANLANRWGPTDYATALSVSTSHLGRLCRQALGMSTSAYIEAARMTEAARLLAFTRMQVADVGYRLGFTDPSYFTRRFHKARGKTPTDYRDQFSDNSLC
ncbi:MAG: AraC family transcriptional activator of pobA [Granulosicoccus sp.]|jgi:AraC family transcriptional activator of pobA